MYDCVQLDFCIVYGYGRATEIVWAGLVSFLAFIIPGPSIGLRLARGLYTGSSWLPF